MKNASNLKHLDSRLLGTVADMAYLAGLKGYYSGNSREDMAHFIWWASEFEQLHAHTDWEDKDYMLAVEALAEEKLCEAGRR